MFYRMQLSDYILGFFGITLVPINMRSILHGLSPEELKESRDPMIDTPLDLFVDCLEKASPKDLDVIGRLIFKESTRDILRRRVGINRALAEHPDILEVGRFGVQLIVG